MTGELFVVDGVEHRKQTRPCAHPNCCIVLCHACADAKREPAWLHVQKDAEGNLFTVCEQCGDRRRRG